METISNPLLRVGDLDLIAELAEEAGAALLVDPRSVSELRGAIEKLLLSPGLRAELADVPGGVRLDFVVRQNMYINRVQIEGLHEPPAEALARAKEAPPGRPL